MTEDAGNGTVDFDKENPDRQDWGDLYADDEYDYEEDNVDFYKMDGIDGDDDEANDLEFFFRTTIWKMALLRVAAVVTEPTLSWMPRTPTVTTTTAIYHHNCCQSSYANEGGMGVDHNNGNDSDKEEVRNGRTRQWQQ